MDVKIGHRGRRRRQRSQTQCQDFGQVAGARARMARGGRERDLGCWALVGCQTVCARQRLDAPLPTAGVRVTYSVYRDSQLGAGLADKLAKSLFSFSFTAPFKAKLFCQKADKKFIRGARIALQHPLSQAHCVVYIARSARGRGAPAPAWRRKQTESPDKPRTPGEERTTWCVHLFATIAFRILSSLAPENSCTIALRL
jgi:hypothetical protein